MALNKRDEAIRKSMIRHGVLAGFRRHLRPDNEPADVTVQRIFAQIRRAKQQQQSHEHWNRLVAYLTKITCDPA